MSNTIFSKTKTVHFIGIGGIGVSAIARMMLLQGKKVTGSDRNASEVTDALCALGVLIVIGPQKAGEVPFGTDLIIYSAAIEVAEPELLAAIKNLSIPSLSYSEALGEISKEKYTIAIAGTHGKTTVTGMVATVLIDGELSPSVVIGSVLNREKSNFVAGNSEYFVVEADEYRRSFLSLSPKVLVINNLDEDHLDYFKDLTDIQSAYAALVAKVPKDGVIITDLSNENVRPVLAAAVAPVLDYRSASVDGLKLPLPGEHNVRNAQVALTVGSFLGIPRDKIVTSLNGFRGTWRRFEYVGQTASGALVYDDYAHNPSKCRAFLSGLRERFPEERIVAIFQPHLFSRTKTLFKDFVTAFGDADEVLFAPIFPAREAPDPTISSDLLAEAVSTLRGNDGTVRSFKSFDHIAEYLKTRAKKGDVVATVGAGDIYKIGKQLVK